LNYLTLENVTKMYGEKVLFKNITLFIDRFQKIALVAKNGTGKTTLMRVLAGVEGVEGETSKIIIRKDIRTGFLHQDPEFRANDTIMEAIFDSPNPMMHAVKAYEHAMLHPEDAAPMQAALAKMDDLKAWDFEAKIKEILFKLNIANFDQRVASLSGGQKKRVALAKLLIEEPDFIILDEPTNHLDLDMIEWLEEYLQKPNLTIFMVTHDRYFLENVCDNIIELDGGTLYRYKGNYSEYLEKKAIREEIEGVVLGKNRQLLKRELDWVRRMPKARTTKSKSRVDAFYDLKELTNKRPNTDTLELSIKFNRLGSKILELYNVSKSYGDRVLIKDFSYKFKPNERVGIVGHNGSGKSTLLKIITESVKPDSGRLVVGETVQFGYYSQDGIQLNEDKRIIEVVKDIAEVIPLEKGRELTAAQMLDRFLFTRDQHMVYASQLSGGERRRLYLLTILMKNPNFLILDEPTNDLDILTLNVLEDFLMEFQGCVIIVTHDRYFMDKLVEHVFVFEGEGQVRDFNGSYTEYRIQKDIEEEQKRIANKPQSAIATKQNSATKLTEPERKELKRLENELKTLETRKRDITEKFNDPKISTDQIKKLSAELGDIQDKIDTKEMRWLELGELAE
jgi:ABC transport system ATP-binding/permease protein